VYNYACYANELAVSRIGKFLLPFLYMRINHRSDTSIFEERSNTAAFRE